MWKVRIWLRYTLPRLLRQVCAWVGRGFKPEPSRVIANIRVLAEHLDHWPDDDDVARAELILSKRVYKSTDCGAWLAFIREPPRERTVESRRYVALLSYKTGCLGVDSLFVASSKEPLYRSLPFNPANPEATWPREVLEYLLLVCPKGYESQFKHLSSYKIEELFSGPLVNGDEWTPSSSGTSGTYEFALDVSVPVPAGETPPFGVWGIQIGSIVEGSDAEVNGDALYFPFTEEQYDAVITDVEERCLLLWWEANEEEVE